MFLLADSEGPEQTAHSGYLGLHRQHMPEDMIFWHGMPIIYFNP